MKKLIYFYVQPGDKKAYIEQYFKSHLENAYRNVTGLIPALMEGFATDLTLQFSEYKEESFADAKMRCEAQSEELGCVVAVRFKDLAATRRQLDAHLPEKHATLCRQIERLTQGPHTMSAEEFAERFTRYAFASAKDAKHYLNCSACGSKVSGAHVIKPDCPVCFAQGSLISVRDQQKIALQKSKISTLQARKRQIEQDCQLKLWEKLHSSQKYGWVVGLYCEMPLPAYMQEYKA